MGVVQDFNRVAVEDTDHLASELASSSGPGKPQSEQHKEENAHQPHGSRVPSLLSYKPGQR
jgi:hypothetical protein